MSAASALQGTGRRSPRLLPSPSSTEHTGSASLDTTADVRIHERPLSEAAMTLTSDGSDEDADQREAAWKAPRERGELLPTTPPTRPAAADNGEPSAFREHERPAHAEAGRRNARRARELYAVDGRKEHLENVELERQALREWMAAEPDASLQLKQEQHALKLEPDGPSLPSRHVRKTGATAREGQTPPPETAAWEQQERALAKLAGGTLPKELVLLVLEHVARRMPALELHSAHCLPSACEELIGTSPPAQELRPLLEQVMLETRRVRLSIPFTRQIGGGDPIAQVPPFVQDLPCPIRHLELTCDVEVPRNRMVYPITVFRLIRGAPSLKAAFPALDAFTLILKMNVEDDPDRFVDLTLDAPCFCGYAATTTYRELILRVLQTLYDSGPGRRKIFTLAFELKHYRIIFEGDGVPIEPPAISSSPTPTPGADEAAISPHPMTLILQKATKVERLARREEQVAVSSTSPGSVEDDPPTPASGYRQRRNEDMLMLEEETRTVGSAGEMADEDA